MSTNLVDIRCPVRGARYLLFMLNQTSKKMALWFLGIIGVGVVVWLGALYLNPEERAKRDALKYFEDLQAQYETDTYGGATPEETLQLFITALEAGDIELASKYFLPDEREKWQRNISEVETGGSLEEMINDLSRAEKTKEENGQALFVVTDETNTVSVLIGLAKNSNTRVWKITDL